MAAIEPLLSAAGHTSPQFANQAKDLNPCWTVLLAVLLAGLPMNVAAAQCPDWIPTFGGEPGVNSTIEDFVVYDDGTGPALYAGGTFTAAGGVSANRIARWDGAEWSPLGSGLSNAVHALAVFDDGGGAALYAAGSFTAAGGVPASRIAKWDGASWSPVGSGLDNTVYDLAVFDDGTGPALYAGGLFTSAGSVPTNHIARWDGESWSLLGEGMLGVGSFPGVLALAVFDDGTGPKLCAGGRFVTAGGEWAINIARWNGATWSSFGEGLGGGQFDEVTTLAVLADAAGRPALYAGGSFNEGGARNVARWTGSAWARLGIGLDNDVKTLAVVDDGTGPSLHAGGAFGARLAKWTGAIWSEVAPGGIWAYSVNALAVFDDGAGPSLFIGGNIDRVAGVSASNVARWDGAAWSPVGGTGLEGNVNALAVFNDGAEDVLYAAGSFTSAGGAAARLIAMWDGMAWFPLGDGLGETQSFATGYALAVFDDGAGPALYAGGRFTRAGSIQADSIAKWDGTTWSPLGAGIRRLQSAGSVRALTGFDDGAGPALYAGGLFDTAGGTPANNIARWNGTAWSALGDGLAGNVDALTVFDDGTGVALYAGGSFNVAAGAPANYIARWSGAAWAPLPAEPGGTVGDLAVFDDGAGPALYAAGWFHTAGGPLSLLAKWDGTAWSALEGGIDPCKCGVYVLKVFNDGTGPALFAGGDFFVAGGTPASSIARWNGQEWSPLGVGIRGAVNAFAIFDDGTGPTLCAGGDFSASPAGDSYLARYGCLNQSTCRAELTGAAPVDVFDLLAYLNLWFASSPDAERTGDSPAAIDVFDLLEYLNVWFLESGAGCS